MSAQLNSDRKVHIRRTCSSFVVCMHISYLPNACCVLCASLSTNTLARRLACGAHLFVRTSEREYSTTNAFDVKTSTLSSSSLRSDGANDAESRAANRSMRECFVVLHNSLQQNYMYAHTERATVRDAEIALHGVMCLSCIHEGDDVEPKRWPLACSVDVCAFVLWNPVRCDTRHHHRIVRHSRESHANTQTPRSR